MIKEISVDDYIRSIQTVRNAREDYVTDIFDDAIRFYTGRSSDNPLQVLTDQWFDSIDRGEPDYSVYADELYLTDAWCCWRIYSRTYIKNIVKKMPFLNDYKTMVDLGCGTGLTTAFLAENFKSLKITATQLANTEQFRIALLHASAFNYEIKEDTSHIGQTDIAIGFEYFEHFERPIEHVEKIVAELKPEVLIIANSFNTPGIGHFKKYKHNDLIIDQKDISRVFNKRLRELGYKKHDSVKFWNNKPTVWVNQ